MLQALLDSVDNWKMVFTTVHFLLFLPVAVGAYFVLPAKARRLWLLAASYYFYFFAAPRYLPVLLCGTLFSYAAALGMAEARGRGGRRFWFLLGLLGMVFGLCFFKYNPLIFSLLCRTGLCWDTAFFTTAGAAGISYYTFTALGYLIDVYRGDVPAEKSFLSHALFLGFFPSVLMGPINRAGSLLPQLNDTSRRFDPAGAADALRLMAFGFFKKLAVANTLAVFVDAVYKDLAAHSGLTLTLAAAAYALQLYFDFGGYTDIALGTAGLLGIRLPQNFNTPYFATNFSSFWSRWHISLSSWLQEYIFTPLVWSRWTEKLPFIGKKVKNPPMLTSLVAVFLVSGLWHGDNLCFLVWGGLQAAFRVGEELLHRVAGKPKKRPTPASRLGKTAVVLVLWAESLVFFRVGTGKAPAVGSALSALLRQFRPVSLAQVWSDITNPIAELFYGKSFMVALFMAFSLLCLAAAIWADWVQCFRLKGTHPALAISTLKGWQRWLVYYTLALCAFAGFILIGGGFDGASFLYGGF